MSDKYKNSHLTDEETEILDYDSKKVRLGAKLELDSRPPGCKAFVLSTTPYLNQRQTLFMIIFFTLEKYLSLMCQSLDE